MEIKKLNKTLLNIEKQLNESEELTLEKAIEIFQDENKESEDVEPMKLKTMVSEYDCFGDLYYAVIKADKFLQYVKDICNEFAESLPDGFISYFNVDAMYSDIVDNDWKAVLFQAQKFLEEKGEEDFTPIIGFEKSFNDCYLVELK